MGEAMFHKQGPSIHQQSLSASLEQHTVWRYVIKDRNTGAVLFDGWAADVAEARQRAETQLDSMCQDQPRVRRAA
jgi:hypothetical protein